MPVQTDRAFRRALQARQFERVYYLFGEDDFLKERAARELADAAVDPATRDFNLDVRAAADLEGAALGSLLGTPPMMAERRLVVVRDVGALRRDARQALDRYLARPAEDIVLVLVAPGGEKAKPDKALVERTCAVDFAPLSEDRVARWIVHHASTELGATISAEAASLLQQAVGNDLPALAAELDKLASYTSGAPIDEGAVSAVVGVRRGETLGDFLDRVARRDAAAALDLLPHILAQPKTTAVSVVMALSTQFLALAWADAMRAGGTPTFRLEGELFGFLKSGGSVFTGRPWGEAVKAWAAAVDQWDAASLDGALDALLTADIALKETRVSSDAQVLATLVLALCTPDAAPSRAVAARRRAAAAAAPR